ncbi:MAG: hypothetical protein RL023_155 [Candidatus Parcubacteria bacterium]
MIAIAAAFVALAFTVVNYTTIPDKLINHQNWSYHPPLIVSDSVFQKKAIIKPAPFNAEVESIFQDSFLTTSASEIFYAAEAFRTAAGMNGGSWVEVGYGIAPTSHPYTPLRMLPKEAHRLLGKYMFGTKLGRLALYERTVPTYLSAFVQKSDSLQAIDLFLVWKTVQYCIAYNEANETARLKQLDGIYPYGGKKSFVTTDWRSREDWDGKLYAFIYRRLHDETGLNIANCQYYSKKLLGDFEAKATPTAKTLATQWQTDWTAGRITTAPHFRIGPKN